MLRVQVNDLLQHPANPPSASAISGVYVDCSRTRDGNLSVSFHTTGATNEIRIPSPRASTFVEGLWQHSCFEVFISADEGPGYYEYNLSPSGQWALFEFRGYRDGEPRADPDFKPVMQFETSTPTFRLEALLPLARVDPRSETSRLRIGLSAVIEHCDGTLGYWALRHPAEAPDFHDANSFALTLEARREA
jgi:hypothetical protein